MADSKSPIAPLLAVNFVGTLGFSIVVPFMVALVTKWGGNAVVYALIAATYSFFQLFGAPILGRMSDRVGRRRVLLLSQLGTLISWLVFLAAFALPTTALWDVEGGFLGEFTLTLPLLVLFLARAADGLTGGNVSVSNAYLADITAEEDRSKNFGQMAISTNLGFIIGPALGGVLGATIFGEILPVFLAMLISVVALALIRFGLREIKPQPITETLEDPNACALYGQEHRKGYEFDCAQPNGITSIFKLPNMMGLMAINFLVMLGFSFFYAAFPVHAVSTLEWSVSDIGIYFAVLSGCMVLVQGPILSRLAKRVPDRVLMTGGGTVLALGFVALLSARLELLYLGAVLIALGNGLMWPTFMAVLANSAGEKMQGAVQGFAGSGGAIASIAGLIAGGVIYVWAGAATFAGAAAIILLTALIAASYRAPVKA